METDRGPDGGSVQTAARPRHWARDLALAVVTAGLVFGGWRAWGEGNLLMQTVVVGRVVDLAGNAVSGARVSLEGRPGAAITGADGSFSLAVAMPGVVWLHLEVGDWSGVRVPVRIAGAGRLDVGSIAVSAPPR